MYCVYNQLDAKKGELRSLNPFAMKMIGMREIVRVMRSGVHCRVTTSDIPVFDEHSVGFNFRFQPGTNVRDGRSFVQHIKSNG
jgi:hypothetical protein